MPVVLLFLSLSLCFSACRKSGNEPGLDAIRGIWERTSSDKPEYNGMRLEVFVDEQSNSVWAEIIYIPSGSNGYFSVGTRKWINIQPIADQRFRLEDLGSSSNIQNYYSATLSLREQGQYMLLKLDVPYNTFGQEQYWIRL